MPLCDEGTYTMGYIYDRGKCTMGVQRGYMYDGGTCMMGVYVRWMHMYNEGVHVRWALLHVRWVYMYDGVSCTMGACTIGVRVRWGYARWDSCTMGVHVRWGCMYDGCKLTYTMEVYV
jgi:hypothetical protein